jgi:hypothetical protein
VVEEVLVWNVGNFRREHFMAEVEKAGCGDNPGKIYNAYGNNSRRRAGIESITAILYLNAVCSEAECCIS